MKFQLKNPRKKAASTKLHPNANNEYKIHNDYRKLSSLFNNSHFVVNNRNLSLKSV